MKNLKKIKKKIFKGVLNPKVFCILIGLFFSTLAIAANLSVTFIGALIPGGNNNTPFGNIPAQQCRGNDVNKTLMNTDRTTSPTDIEFDADGSFVYTSNAQTAGMSNNTISQNHLLRNYQILSDAIRAGTLNCDHLKGADPRSQSGYLFGSKTHDIEIHRNGKLFFFLDDSRRLGKFEASIPYDLNTLTFKTRLILNGAENSIEFNKDGTKIFALDQTANTPTIATYQLPGAYDISSKTEIHKVDLNDLDIEDVTGEDEYGQDLEFNSDGSVMFVLISNGDIEQEYIYHFDLGKNYDISTAVKAGRFHVGEIFMNRAPGDRFGDPSGFGFSRDGMNLYLLDNKSSTGVHQINQYKLDCPYGLVKCSSDSSASIDSQVELAKQNITLNVSTIFKRFEWIKRNRNNEDLSIHNININYPNPLLKSFANKFEPSFKRNLLALVSNNQTQKKKKKSKWSSWSLADILIGHYDETFIDKPKDIIAKNLTFGADRKFGDNKFFGMALRYGNSESDIRRSVQDVDLESITLNFYGISSVSDNQYINGLLGLSAIRINNKYLGEISGERNGKQAFASINYRTLNTFSKFNITPTGKFTYGITQLSEFTDFLSDAVDRPATNIRYAKDTFESGELAAGFLFEVEKFESSQGTIQPMGGIEILYDLTPDINYKYTYLGSTAVNKEKILGAYSRQNLKTNIGFEAVHINGFTFSTDYQRVIRLNDKSNASKFDTDRFLFKFSHSKNDNTNFTFDFDPLVNNFANISYVKDIGNFNLKFNSNYSSFNRISDYAANIELTGAF